jgi:hypothetical protein
MNEEAKVLSEEEIEMLGTEMDTAAYCDAISLAANTENDGMAQELNGGLSLLFEAASPENGTPYHIKTIAGEIRNFDSFIARYSLLAAGIGPIATIRVKGTGAEREVEAMDEGGNYFLWDLEFFMDSFDPDRKQPQRKELYMSLFDRYLQIAKIRASRTRADGGSGIELREIKNGDSIIYEMGRDYYFAIRQKTQEIASGVTNPRLSCDEPS